MEFPRRVVNAGSRIVGVEECKKEHLLMNRYGFLLLLIFSPLHADVFKWTDNQGVVHFSDKPHPNAVKVDLPALQSFSSPPAPTPSEQPAPTNGEEQNLDAVSTEPYEQVRIIQPIDQETIRNNQGALQATLLLEPSLKSGDKVQLMFDGAALGEPRANTVFNLQDINRGSHTINFQVINANGDVLNTSNTITVFMQRPRVGMVPQTAR